MAYLQQGFLTCYNITCEKCATGGIPSCGITWDAYVIYKSQIENNFIKWTGSERLNLTSQKACQWCIGYGPQLYLRQSLIPPLLTPYVNRVSKTVTICIYLYLQPSALKGIDIICSLTHLFHNVHSARSQWPPTKNPVYRSYPSSAWLIWCCLWICFCQNTVKIAH